MINVVTLFKKAIIGSLVIGTYVATYGAGSHFTHEKLAAKYGNEATEAKLYYESQIREASEYYERMFGECNAKIWNLESQLKYTVKSDTRNL